VILQSRRSFITGLAALVAAPAVVRASSLMPVKAPKLLTDDETLQRIIRMFEESNRYLVDMMQQQIADSIFYGSAQMEVKSGLSGLLARPVSRQELYLGS